MKLRLASLAHVDGDGVAVATASQSITMIVSFG